MKHNLTLVVAAAFLFPAASVQAQATFSIGPRLGLNVANVPFKDQKRTYNTNARAGVEAGVVANLGFGHFAVQPAFLFSQKGFTVEDTYTTTDNTNGLETRTTTLSEQYRLNYFTLPLNLVYAQHEDGQGIQVFAGPYFGKLLGGTYRYDDKYVIAASGSNSTSTEKGEGDIGTGDYYTTNRTDTKFYSRSTDAGLQFGLGYRAGGALFQAGYSVGLRNLGADFKVNYGGSFGTKIISGPTYNSRVLQASFTYLFGSANAVK